MIILIASVSFAFIQPLDAMPYSTNTDLIQSVDEKQVMQLIDDENTLILTVSGMQEAADDPGAEFHEEAKLMSQRIDRARTDADELIDSFVRTQYSLPLAVTPGIVNMLSVDLTYVNLYERRFRGQLPEGMKALYAQSLEKLKLIQSGKMSIQDTPDIAAGQIAVKASKKVFTDDYLKRF